MKLFRGLSIFLFIFFGVLNLQAKVKMERVEPPFWWVGMNNPELQIMLQADDISQFNVEIDYPGISLSRVEKVPNPNFLFVYLNISSDSKPGVLPIVLKNTKGKIQAEIQYELKKRDKQGAEYQGFSQEDVMYLITPDRFVNGDPSNDDMPGMLEKANRNDKNGRHGGDIAGIDKALPYIKDMGFTAIWVNPVLENNMPAFSYHGYAATDFYKIDPRYGTNEQYRDLSIKASKMGIKMIMDLILNHCGSEHWWMKDMPTPDWINHGNEYVRTNHRRQVIQDPYVSQEDYKGFADGWFVETMPDMNQRNPIFATYLIQNSIWWVEYAKLAGIRMDTYPYPDKDFMTDWTCALMDEYPNLNIVGEEWTENPALVAHWQKGKVNPNGYTSCLPSLMDFPLQGALTRGLRDQDSRYGSGLIKIYDMLTNDFLYADPFELVIFPDNHDMDRFYTQVNEDIDLYKMGMAYIATMRGIPQIYYGTEVLMSNTGHPGEHAIIRSDFPGGWEGDETDAMSGKGLSEEQKEAQEVAKKIFNWRKTAKVVHDGKLMHYAPEDGVYVFFRYDDDNTVMVVLNKNVKPTFLNTERFHERLEGFSSGKDVLTDKEFKLDELVVPARAALILELD